ncbi:hypothetical protein ACLI4Z_02785 [Natrialbaceae archaeon A-arb3/5]
MRRRTLLAAAAGVLIAGCTTAESGGKTTTDPENESADNEGDGTDDVAETDETDDAETEELVDRFRSSLEERGFEGVTADLVDDGIELGYDATGTADDDVAAEIELIADGYTTGVERGLSTARLDATAFNSDGDVLDHFEIETDWVDAYLSDSIEWRELLTRIAATFESNESDDDIEPDGEETAVDGD